MNTYFLIKVFVSAIIIALISEISKRSTGLGALLASLPLISITAFFWIYFDTKDLKKISDLSIEIFWLVIPTLPFFLVLPFLLRHEINFYVSMGISCFVSIICYVVTLRLLGINL